MGIELIPTLKKDTNIKYIWRYEGLRLKEG